MGSGGGREEGDGGPRAAAPAVDDVHPLVAGGVEPVAVQDRPDPVHVHPGGGGGEGGGGMGGAGGGWGGDVIRTEGMDLTPRIQTGKPLVYGVGVVGEGTGCYGGYGLLRGLTVGGKRRKAWQALISTDQTLRCGNEPHPLLKSKQ